MVIAKKTRNGGTTHKGKSHMVQGDIFVETRYHAPWNPIHNTA